MAVAKEARGVIGIEWFQLCKRDFDGDTDEYWSFTSTKQFFSYMFIGTAISRLFLPMTDIQMYEGENNSKEMWTLRGIEPRRATHKSHMLSSGPSSP